MKSVSVSHLKAHLSRYLRQVRRGDEVQVLDRGVPMARIVALGAAPRDESARRQRLIRAGVLRAGAGRAERVLRRPLLRLPGADLSGALRAERADRA